MPVAGYASRNARTRTNESITCFCVLYIATSLLMNVSGRNGPRGIPPVCVLHGRPDLCCVIDCCVCLAGGVSRLSGGVSCVKVSWTSLKVCCTRLAAHSVPLFARESLLIGCSFMLVGCSSMLIGR